MARTEIPINNLAPNGVATATPVVGDIVNNMQIAPNDGMVWLQVQNPSTTAALKFSVLVTGAVAGTFPIPPEELEVPKEATKLFGPFEPAAFNQKGSAVFINPASAELKFTAYRL